LGIYPPEWDRWIQFCFTNASLHENMVVEFILERVHGCTVSWLPVVLAQLPPPSGNVGF